MRKLLSKLWADDGGFIISVEMLFITVILVIGIIGGLAALRAAVATELALKLAVARSALPSRLKSPTVTELAPCPTL